LDEAKAYARLHSEFSLSQEKIAETVGKDRATIANSLRLLKLPPAVHPHLVTGALSAGHARALLMLETADEQLRVATQAVSEGLSVRAVEQLVRDLRQLNEAPNEAKSSGGAKSVDEVPRAVSIQRAGTRGAVSPGPRHESAIAP
jgi:ParB family chromosome partitioning protein